MQMYGMWNKINLGLYRTDDFLVHKNVVIGSQGDIFYSAF